MIVGAQLSKFYKIVGRVARHKKHVEKRAEVDFVLVIRVYVGVFLLQTPKSASTWKCFSRIFTLTHFPK